MTNLTEFVTQELFSALTASYGTKWDVDIVLFNEGGDPVLNRPAPHYDPEEIRRAVKMHISESLRWGEAPFALLPDGGMMWLVPVMVNTRVLGGVAAFISAGKLSGEWGAGIFPAVREAAEELRTVMERENLTNGPLLEMLRNQYLFERRRAEAIHDFKEFSYDYRLLYIRDEPILLNAIRSGDREQARGILNQILLVLFNQAGENLNLVKSYVLEIITMMSRAAVEAGCETYQVFGNKYEEFVELCNIEHDYEFSGWLHQIMERLIDAIRQNKRRSAVPQLHGALEYMREHLAETISREHVAEVAHMSPSHFSRTFKKTFRENFSDVLNRMRIEHSILLLSGTNANLSEIALSCGFKDQSYFTKMFKKFHHQTPFEYRARLKKR